MTSSRPDKSRPGQDGGSGSRRAAAGDDLALKITHAEMDAAVNIGDAIPLALSGGWLTHYLDAWWVQSEIGWLRVTDEATTADIDHVAARLAEIAEDVGSATLAHGANQQSPDGGVENRRGS
jgi:hypothetical protein